MEEPSLVIRHIESFVDSKCSSSQQAASLNAIASVLKNGELDIEQLVREMGMYLTNTDSIVRARGILLLAELLACLASKPLDGAALHSLIRFFTDRLADWKALRGALLGCLALVRRKSNVGMVTGSDAKAVAQAYLENLQVQSLAQHDRKLCFELMECLLERYPEEVASLGDDLIYGICAAIDEEKDPQCLLRTFHIVEVMGQLFPGPSDPLASFAEDLFEILGCYFPIHFTHPKGEDVDVKRDELSRALMLAFSSTPLFEPFAIPLLLEKLSSSLTSAKIDSLKYLAHCTRQYGADRMEKHVGAIWCSLKDAICASQEPTLSFAPHSLGDPDFKDSEIATEALMVLQKLLVQNNDSLLRLIIGDHDVKMVFNSIIGYKSYTDISLESKQKLIAIGRVLSVTAKTSIVACNEVFESFFPHLMDTLGISGGNSSEDWFPDEDHVQSKKLNFGALYLCIELLVACRNLALTSKDLMSNSSSMNMLQSFSTSLTKALSSTLVTKSEDTQDADIYIQVQGLQILATFSGLISNGTFEKILMTLMTIITVDFNKPLLWKLAMKAIVNIGFYVDRSIESEKELSYIHIVVEKLISLLYLDDASMPFLLKLEAISDISTSGKKPMLKVVQGLEEAIFANLLEVHVHGNLKSADTGVGLLECYSDKVLPWILKTGGFEEVMLRFAVNIWNQFEKWPVISEGVRDKELLDATTKSLKLVVANCSEESQNVVMQKAYDQFSSSMFFQTRESTSDSVPVQQLESLLLIEDFSFRDEWLLSLFSSVVIAARPQTRIPCIRVVLRLFMTTLLKGYSPAAQAIGSIVNKLGVKSDASSGCTLEEAMDIIFKTSLCSNGSELCVTDLCLGVASSRLLRVHAITGLAWIGKGLLLRGHEKVKDITMVFLEGLQSSGEMTVLSPLDGHFPETKCAADAFHVLMSDSEVCLNKKFHAVIRPLYKQRFYSIMVPILQSLILKSDSAFSRPMLYRAFAHVVCDTPISVILSDAKKIIPILLVSLPALSKDISDKDMVYNLLLVLSGMLTDKNGHESVLENAHVIVNCLTGLVAYPHSTIVRETAIQCLVAVSGLPHARIYPMRTQVLQAVSKALDDPKRVVRQEAVRCRRAWSMLSGTWFR